MGRNTISIKKIERESSRRVTFNKRRNGLLKKAYELSILCDVDMALIIFSPNGEVTHFANSRSNVEDIILKFANFSPLERSKSQSRKPLTESKQFDEELPRKMEKEEILQEVSHKLRKTHDSLVACQERTSNIAELIFNIQKYEREISNATSLLRLYEGDTSKLLSIQQVIDLQHRVQATLQNVQAWKMCEFQAQICNISRSESSHILSPWSNAEKTSIKELDNTQDEIFRDNQGMEDLSLETILSELQPFPELQVSHDMEMGKLGVEAISHTRLEHLYQFGTSRTNEKLDDLETHRFMFDSSQEDSNEVGDKQYEFKPDKYAPLS